MKYLIWLALAFVVVFAGVIFVKQTRRNVIEAMSESSGLVIAQKDQPIVVAPQVHSPMLSASRPPREPETIAPTQTMLTREQFVALTDKVLERIPRKKDLRKLSATEAHHVPRAIEAVGEGFGRVAEALERQPEFAREAFGFYEKCATEKDYANSARALCYHHYADLGAKNRFSMLGEGKVDEKVKELAKNLD